MATEYHLITQNGTAGSYWAGLTTEQKNRYYSGGAYQVYSNFNDLEDQRINQAVNRDPSKNIVIEVQGKWDDASPWNSSTVWLGYYSVTITTKINGVRDAAAFHNGVPGGGFRRIVNTTYPAYQIQKQSNMTIDGLEIINQNTTGGYAIRVYYAANTHIKNCILTGYRGLECLSYASKYQNNIFRNCLLYGISINAGFGYSDVVNNNLATGCGTGVYSDGATTYATVINNVSIGNTTNWTATGIGTNGYAANNAGLSGEAWDTSGSTRVTVATTDFNNLTGGDFTYVSGSPLINSGIDFVAFSADNRDILNKYRPDYESATYPNNTWDIGPFEYDHGEGNTPPNYRNFTINGLVSGSRVKIKKTADGTVIHNAVVSSTSLTISYNAGTANTPVTIDIRKGSAAPYYKPYRTTSSISYLADTEISVTQIEAIAADTYDAGIATDWSINTGTKAITRNSGGQYPLQDLYSWLLDYYDDESTVDLDMPIEGITPTQFELINSGSISDTDMQYLNSGSLWIGTTLWANLTVVGTLAADTTAYVHVDGSEYTGYWGTGNIDVSLKFVSFDGTEVVDVRAHKYTDTYDHWHFDGLGEGLNYAALSTADDPNNQTASGTVAAYGITVTVDNPTDQQIDGTDTPADYTTTVDGNGLGVQEVYEYLKYLTKEKSVYVSANAAYDEVKTAPYGTFAGGVFFGARGIWLENVASGDALNYVLTDNTGVTHQASAPPVAITVTNIIAGSRIQVYDQTNSTELANEIVAGTTYSLTKSWSTDLDIRIRLMHQSTVTAYEFYEAQGSFTATGMAMRANQELDAVYNVNAIDGSTITGVTINDGLLLVSVSTGAITWQQLYAYETYWLFTGEGIRDEGRFAVAQDPANYLWYDFKIKNTTSPSAPLVVTGGYGRDGDTGAALNMIDTTGGTIIFAPDHVVAYAAGAEATVAIVQSGLTAQGYSTARAGNLDALSGGTMDANLVSVNGIAVSGSGTESDPWGP